MFKNFLKIAFRNLWKHKGYAAINIIGLSIGMAVCLLVFLFIRYQTSFDNFHKNENRIYRVVTTWRYPDRMEYSPGIPSALPAAMKEDFPGIEKVAAVIRSGSQITVPGTGNQGNKKFDESGHIFIVSPKFYQIFHFPLIAGNPKTALQEPNSVIITKSEAKKYFGDWRQAIGKTLFIDNEQPVKVTGILKNLPENTDFPIKIAVSYATVAHDLYQQWSFVSTEFQSYILLKKNARISNLDSRLPAFVKKYYPNDNLKTGLWGFAFQPLKQIHFSTRYGAYGSRINPTELKTFGLVGLFILLIACINFINMSTAQSSQRAKEVGIRKVMGSLRKKLMIQFISETLVIALVAMCIACVITKIVLPPIRHFFNQPIFFNLSGDPIILLFLAGTVLVTGFLAGLYPALIMSGFDPITALKNKITTSGSHGFRKILVVLQFTVTIMIVLGMLVMTKQMQFFKNQPMGFNTSAISLVSLPDDSASISRYRSFENTLSQFPGIENTTLCSDAPSSPRFMTTYFSYNNTKRQPFTINLKYADTGYFNTFGLRLVAGHIFHVDDTMKEVVVNETLLKKLHITDPEESIGKYLVLYGQKNVIVGVVRDFVNFSLANKIAPMAIGQNKLAYRTIAIKLNSHQIDKTMNQVKTAFNQVFPEYIYQANYFDQQIAGYYITENRMTTLFKIFAIIVVLISVIGLLSLLSFVTVQRTKEIAVRRVLGASLKDIILVIGKDFVLLVILANIVALPIVYIFAQKWLNSFAYRINMPVWPFVIATVLSIVLTIMIVSVQAWKAARANPVKALQYE